LGAGVAAVRVRPSLALLLAVAVLLGVCSEGIDRLRELHLLRGFEFPVLADLDPVYWFAALNASALLLGLGVLTVMRRTVDPARVDLLPALLGTVFVGLFVSVGLFAWTGQVWIAFAAWCAFAALRRAQYPFVTAWLNHQLDPGVRATVLSLHGQAGALGEMTGGPALGWIARAFAVRTALAVGALALAPAVALFARNARDSRRT
jgi:DHA3 family tetracycline resistance protein-like MFS transporter